MKNKSEIKTVVTIPKWAEYLQASNKLNSSQQAFALVPLIYRAVYLRCNALTSIPFRLMFGDREKNWDDIFVTPFKSLLWKTEASLLLCGSGYWLKMDTSKKRMGAQWLNPYTVNVKATQRKTDDGAVIVEKTFTQRVGKDTFGPWTSDEVVHFLTFNPANDIERGLSSADVALGAGKTLYYLRSFSSQFFENGAMPVTILGLDINAGPDDIERTRNFFERMTTGIRRAFGVIALRGDVKPSTITPDLNTLDMPNVRNQAVQDIAWAFGIPETMLTDAANYATAVEHRRSFYEETIVPSAENLADIINTQFLNGTGLSIEVHPEELDIFQEDENQRSVSLLNLVSAGVPLEAAFDILGFEVSEESMALMRNQEEAPAAIDTMSEDLRKWKRKSIKNFEKKGTADVDFQSELIPEADYKRIRYQLQSCKSKDDIANVFDENKHATLDDLVKSLQDATMALLDE